MLPNTKGKLKTSNLVVATNTKQRGSSSGNLVGRNLAELFDDELMAEKLFGPVVDGAASPEGRLVVVRDGVDADVMAAAVKLLRKIIHKLLIWKKESQQLLFPKIKGLNCH